MKVCDALNGYLIFLRSGGYSSVTIQNYTLILNRIVEYLGNPEVENITLSDLRSYLISLSEKGLAESSRQVHWKVIKAFFSWAENELEIKRPDTRLKMPTVPAPDIEPFTEEEVRRLLKACETSSEVNTPLKFPYTMRRSTAMRDKLLILLLLDTGMRISELCRVKLSDINIEDGTIGVRSHETGKKSRSRTVRFGVRTKKILWRILNSKENDDDLLFVSTKNNPFNRFTAKSVLARIGKRANVKKACAHRFRHTFAIQYLRNGGDIYTLQSLLGHKSLSTVRLYLKISEIDISEAHRRFGPVDNWRLS